MIGVLGGMGPAATVDFFRRIVQATFRRIVQATPAKRDQDHLHVLIDNDPSVPDRTRAVAGEGTDPGPRLAAMAVRLERAGADVLVMPCNTAYSFAGAVTAAVGIPLLDWPLIAIENGVAGGAKRIGLLATDGTVASRIYEQALRRQGAHEQPLRPRAGELVLPDETRQAETMAVIYSVKERGARPDDAARLEALTESLLQDNADVLLLACTELSVLSDALTSATHRVSLMDASDIVARAAVTFALDGERD